MGTNVDNVIEQDCLKIRVGSPVQGRVNWQDGTRVDEHVN